MGHIFEPDRLHEIARSAMGLPFDAMVDKVAQGLAEAYSGHINTEIDWVFSLVAGATGVLTIFHGSLTEYVILFGTPIGTEGFSGRYKLDIWDFVITGDMDTYTEECVGQAIHTGPGEGALLRCGQVKGYTASRDCWMLEYGRGNIPSCLPVGVGDALLSAQDVRTVARTFKTYGKAVCRELLKGKI
ncbi:MAG: hypothetical protein HN348_35685 [Proteobacteria bacterium]|jgi:hypothetical protein|nr:hypothetical protein [Pseudomonadota bacterium]